MTVGDILAALAHEDDAREVFAADVFGAMRTPIGAVLTVMAPDRPTVVLLILDA